MFPRACRWCGSVCFCICCTHGAETGSEPKIAAAYEGVVFECDRRSKDQETCRGVQ